VKVGVVGGAGFIGSNLVDALVERGDDVLVVDNLSTGYRANLNPAAPLEEVDIAVDSERLTSVLHGREVVFLTAAMPRVPRSIEDPVGTHEVNVTGALRVFKAAVDAGVRRVVYSSSSSVYGDQPTLPLTEDMPPNPLNPYACQKLMCEIYARNFARIYGLETVCLRYFNVYGPRQVTEGAYRLVIGIFMDQRQRGEPLTIHGDGQQTRDFTWVGDVVRANMLAGDSAQVGAGEPINIGAGQEVSIARIAELIGGPVTHLAPRGFDERFKRADIRRAGELLGWAPEVQIDEGMRRLMERLGSPAR
jgi:nucleoside-diphosphate-sugar epimerase